MIAVLVSTLLSGSVLGSDADTAGKITVVYPKADQRIGAVDSTFIFGNVPARRGQWAYELHINGHPVAVHEDGGFLAFLPIEPGAFRFEMQADLVYKGRESYEDYSQRHDGEAKTPLAPQLIDTLQVMVPQPLVTLGADSLAITGSYDPPSGDIAITSGQKLNVAFRGTPGCRAWFSLDSILDSVPMAEGQPTYQPYWGEAVFGRGAVPDSMMLRGTYFGTIEIADSVHIDTTRITYHLAPPSLKDIVVRLFGEDYELAPRFDLFSYLRLARRDSTITQQSSYNVSCNSHRYPFTVRFEDSVQIIRHGPRKGYFATFQPRGVEALAVGQEGDWYRLQMSPTQVAWAYQGAVTPLDQGVSPPHSYLRSIRTFASDNGVRVEFPLAGKHPFRVIEDDARKLRILLFGVTSDTDWIRYDTRDDIIDIGVWEQVEPELYEFTLNLKQDLWGYDTYYRDNTFCLEIHRPPDSLWTIRNKVIVIDPGHSLSPGAIGPTGYTEAEANLGISLAVRDELVWRGARVIMTRDSGSDVALYARPAIAKASGADLFVSIHNNALPDGVNPFVNFGTSAYYYQPHSIDLARAIQRELLIATGLPDRGVYHGNLAVNRPTQYPAVLLECVYMMLPEQEAALKTSEFRKRLGRAIANGIERFFEERDDG
jgi:N-acetylmuramoyl-L-alanine amidase